MHETGFAEAGSSIDERVLALWRDVFPNATVLPTDDFFALGGYSMLVIRMITELEDVFGVRLALRDFFEEPTPSHMAELVRAGRARQPPLEAVSDRGADFGVGSEDDELLELLAQIEYLPDER